MAVVLLLVALTIDMRQGAMPLAPIAEATVAPVATLLSPAARLQRPNYRHSVIAGGAFTRDELAAAFREDAVVAAHYRAVDTDRVREVVTSRPRIAYVSYRIGHRVYWTRNPVRIPAGETLLTDGVTEIRARCGNGISDAPRQPVSTVEPPAHELDNLEGDSSTSGERTLSNTAPVGTPFVPFFQLAQQSILNSDGPDDLPEEIRPVSSAPLALLAYLIDPAGPASNDRNSLFDASEPSARGDLLSDPVNGGRPFLAGVSGLGGSGGPNGGGSNDGGSNGGGSNDGGSNGGGSNGGGSNGGGSNGGGSNGGGSNDGGSNDGGSNGGGSNDGGSTGGGSNGGGSNGGGSNGGGSNGGGSNGGGSNGGGSNGGGSNGGSDVGPGGGGQDAGGDTLPTTYPGSEDLIEDENEDDIPAVPEPGAVLLLGLGLAAATLRRRR